MARAGRTARASLMAACGLLFVTFHQRVALEPAERASWPATDWLDIPSSSAQGAHMPRWGYGAGEHWADESSAWATCAGNAQSPVDVQRFYWAGFWTSAWAEKLLKADRAATGPLVWHIAPTAARKHDQTFSKGVAFDGRSIAVPFKHLPAKLGGALVTLSAPDGSDFDLDAMRVHTPSEHTFDGNPFAMEIQFEHSRVHDGKTRRLIVSVFLHKGEESPAFLRKIADAARLGLDSRGQGGEVEGLEVDEEPFAEIAKDVLMQTEMPLEVTHHLHHRDKSPYPKASYRGRQIYEHPHADVPNYKAYYWYQGSSTRPPCSENVEWVLLKHSLPVSTKDLRAVMDLTGDDARSTQKLNGRLIFDSNM